MAYVGIEPATSALGAQCCNHLSYSATPWGMPNNVFHWGKNLRHSFIPGDGALAWKGTFYVQTTQSRPTPTSAGLWHPSPVTVCPNHPGPTAQSPAGMIPTSQSWVSPPVPAFPTESTSKALAQVSSSVCLPHREL